MWGAGQAIVVLLAACGARSRAVPAGGVDLGTDAGHDAGGAETRDASPADAGNPGRCVDPSEKPPDGPIGKNCETDDDCEGDLFCWEGMGSGVCTAWCDPDLPDSCSAGAQCAGGLGPEGDNGVCLDTCVVSDANPSYQSACGCEPGWSCNFLACSPGCRSNEGCCLLRYLRPEDAESRECNSRCLSESSRCHHDGRPGARIGDPCLISEECPVHAFCRWFDWTPIRKGVRYPVAGVCTGDCNGPPGFPDVCSVDANAVCVDEDPLDTVPRGCFGSCTPGGDPCSRADFVCYPLEAGGGYCFPSCLDRHDFFCDDEGRGGTCEPSGLCSGE